uniref:Secreted protein n=1 Tax=Steinernema glaseri TaxID=37863 RepID=A0A1I7YT49_9BILA
MKSFVVVLLVCTCLTAAAPWNNLGLTKFFKTLKQYPQKKVEPTTPIGTPLLIHPDCLELITPSFAYNSFSMPSFTFRSDLGRCVMIYGVRARHGLVNFFLSYESCVQQCCSGTAC